MKGFAFWVLFAAFISNASFALAPWEPIQGAGKDLGNRTMWRPSRVLTEHGIRIPFYRMYIEFKEETQGFAFAYNAKGITKGEIDLVNGTARFRRAGDKDHPGRTMTCSDAPGACLDEMKEIQFYISDFRRHMDLFKEGHKKQRALETLGNADLKLKAMRDQIARLYGVSY